MNQKPRPDSEWLRAPVPHLFIVDAALWKRVEPRRREAETRAVRLAGGRLSPFEALSCAHGRRQAFVYACAAHRRKGKHICANNPVIPMEAADEAILSVVVEHDTGTLARVLSGLVQNVAYTTGLSTPDPRPRLGGQGGRRRSDAVASQRDR